MRKFCFGAASVILIIHVYFVFFVKTENNLFIEFWVFVVGVVLVLITLGAYESPNEFKRKNKEQKQLILFSGVVSVFIFGAGVLVIILAILGYE